MKKAVLLAVVWAFMMLPPAFALNCTLYEGEQNELCGVVNPLDISEGDKEALMQPSIYGLTEPDNSPIVLNLNLPEESPVTLNSIYENNISRAWNILLFTLVHYVAFSVATRSSLILKWLRVDSLT